MEISDTNNIEVKPLNEQSVVDALIEFEKILSKEITYPDLKEVDNMKLMQYLFDLLESEKYEIKLSPNFKIWRNDVLEECLYRGLVTKKNHDEI